MAEHLGQEYKIVGSGTIGGTHLIMFSHFSVYDSISQLEVKTVATGVGNFIGNKGAVALSFNIGGTKMLIVGCHLTSGQNSVLKRNNDFMRIENEIFSTENRRASECVDCSIFLGDYNYRINGEREAVEILANLNVFDPLKKGDQLLMEMNEGSLFNGFLEGQIYFAPTYRFDVGTNRYDTSKKKRIPA